MGIQAGLSIDREILCRDSVENVTDFLIFSSLRFFLTFREFTKTRVDRLFVDLQSDLAPKNVSLAECFNSDNENGNDKNIDVSLPARMQAIGTRTGRGWTSHCGGGRNAGCG